MPSSTQPSRPTPGNQLNIDGKATITKPDGWTEDEAEPNAHSGDPQYPFSEKHSSAGITVTTFPQTHQSLHEQHEAQWNAIKRIDNGGLMTSEKKVEGYDTDVNENRYYYVTTEHSIRRTEERGSGHLKIIIKGIWMLHDETVYAVTYNANEHDYDRFYDTFRNMASTFRFN